MAFTLILVCFFCFKFLMPTGLQLSGFNLSLNRLIDQCLVKIHDKDINWTTSLPCWTNTTSGSLTKSEFSRGFFSLSLTSMELWFLATVATGLLC